jgi:hypothetical protein
MAVWKVGRAAIILAALAAMAPSAWAAPDVISRQQWGAHDPVLPMTKQVPMRITVHHTASRTKPGLSIAGKLKNLQSFSQSKAKLADGRTKKLWPDIPYHFYIAVDGKIAEGRPIGFVGDTNTSYDPTGHITIVVEGNFEIEKPSAAELASLKSLIVSLAAQYHIVPALIGVHSDFAQTACPGKNLEGEVRSIAAAVK